MKQLNMLQKMSDENDWILIQDTSWAGYEDIPRDIMVGYQTIIHELENDDFIWPTHVVMQAGVILRSFNI